MGDWTAILLGAWKDSAEADKLRGMMEDEDETISVLTTMMQALQAQATAKGKGKVRAVSRSIPPRWRSIRFRLTLRTYAPWGVRVVSLTKSKKIPTQKIFPLFFVIKAKIKKKDMKKRIASVEQALGEALTKREGYKAEIDDLHASWRFGIRINDFCEGTRMLIHPVIKSCTDALTAYGLKEEGIFRVPGDTGLVGQIKNAFERGENPLSDWSRQKSLDEGVDASTIASCLKLYLRQLPDPVMTMALYDEVLNICRVPEAERMPVVLHLLHGKLPPAHLEVLKLLLPFLQLVSTHSLENKMTVQNLAVVFGPTLIRTRDDNVTAMMTDSPGIIRVTIYLLENHTALLDGAAQPAPTAPTAPTAQLQTHLEEVTLCPPATATATATAADAGAGAADSAQQQQDAAAARAAAGHTYENVVVSKRGGAAYENHTFDQSRVGVGSGSGVAGGTAPAEAEAGSAMKERKASAYDSEADDFV